MVAEELRERRCAIFAYDAYKTTVSRPRPLPDDWENHQHSTGTWLHRSLESHPWRVATSDAADLAYVDVDFSSLCRPVRKEDRRGWVPQRQMWNALHKRDMPFMSSLLLPKAVVRQQQACANPWGPERLPPNVIQLHEYHSLDELQGGVAFTQELISPFVISRPDWLTGLTEPPASVVVGWRTRKLLIFAGHVPKLTNRPHRYLLWRQLHNDRRVTTQSHSINCTIGQFSDCSLGRELLATRGVLYFQTVCQSYCEAPTRWSGHLLAGQTACAPKASRPPALMELRQRFERSCRPLIPGKLYGAWTTRHRLRPDYARELPHYHRDSSQVWSYETYLKQVMGHRFCLVAMGDKPGTPKITEMIAVGGAGGCIPVIVLPGAGPNSMQMSMLPYVRWLDYCTIAYLVPSAVAEINLKPILKRLSQVSKEEAERKREALRAVRDAFVMRKNSSVDAPAAAEFLLGELCDLARAYRDKRSNAATRARAQFSVSGFHLMEPGNPTRRHLSFASSRDACTLGSTDAIENETKRGPRITLPLGPDANWFT